MKRLAKIENDWVRCRECGHKLFRVNESSEQDRRIAFQVLGMEVKCHSCKTINEVRYSDDEY